MQDLTLAELTLKRAQLHEKAAKLRFEQQHTAATSSRASHLAKAVRLTQARVEDYNKILDLVHDHLPKP